MTTAKKIDGLLTRYPEIVRETRDCTFKPTDDRPEMEAELAAMDDDETSDES